MKRKTAALCAVVLCLLLTLGACGEKKGGDVTAAGMKMQWLLTLEGLALSFAAAILMTYLVEIPCRKYLLRTDKTSKIGSGNGPSGSENNVNEESTPAPGPEPIPEIKKEGINDEVSV